MKLVAKTAVIAEVAETGAIVEALVILGMPVKTAAIAEIAQHVINRYQQKRQPNAWNALDVIGKQAIPIIH